MELVDMNSLGLFDIKILSVQVGFTLFLKKRACFTLLILRVAQTTIHIHYVCIVHFYNLLPNL